ncbi:MAG: TIGR03621 family F420-dependent LLM class oxidoreductase [Actinobacteria bacterium]|jgi:probable F420-dependent oxidoreductase|nr:TIGR03621 family F420-dependent LLM class oxidoreductase [Actinomycetota bacterium]
MRPFRFGFVFTGEARADEWRDLARRAEGDGWSTVLVADHFHNPMACLPLMAMAAGATSTLRVGSYVFANDFRHPALLAKEMATLDVLSGGRVELGIGAGWAKEEYDGVGIPFEPGPVRASRLEEAVALIKAVLAGGAVTFAGAHYRLTDYEALPVPVQPRIPLLLGGGGPRLMRLAAREADIVGVVPQSMPGGGLDPEAYTTDSFRRRHEALESALAAAGRRDDVERSVLVFHAARDLASVDAREGVDVQPDSPYTLVGDVGQMAETLQRRREEWGQTYPVFFADDIDLVAPVVRRLAGT